MQRNGSETSSTRDSSPMAKLTPVQLSMFDLATWWHSNNATSSPALVDGAEPCALPVSPTIDPSGPAPAPANHSRSRASRKDLPTNAISGPSGGSLSASDALQRSMESRLRQLLNGSDLCEVIWKPWTTPWGQSLAKPRARVRTISETDTGLWATIRASDGEKGGPNMQFGAGGQPLPSMAAWSTPRSSPNENYTTKPTPSQMAGKHGQYLAVQAITASAWPTPTTRDHKDGGYCPNVPVNGLLGRMVWPTPTSCAPAKNGNNEAGNSAGLVAIRKHALAMYQTPRANKWGPPDSHGNTMAWNGLSEQTEKRGALNPEFVCWLMGYPPEWLSCAPSEMPSTSGRRRRSSVQRCEL